MAKVRLFPDVILGKLRKIKRPDYGLNKELRSITRNKDSEPPEHEEPTDEVHEGLCIDGDGFVINPMDDHDLRRFGRGR